MAYNPKIRLIHQNIFDFVIGNYGNLNNMREFLDLNGLNSAKEFDDVPIGTELKTEPINNKVLKTYSDNNKLISTSTRVETFNDVLMEEYLTVTSHYFSDPLHIRGQLFKITNTGDATKLNMYVHPDDSYNDLNMEIYLGNNGSNGTLLFSVSNLSPVAGLIEIPLPKLTLTAGTDYSLIYWRSPIAEVRIKMDLLADSVYPLPYMFFRDYSPNILLTGGAIQFQIYSETKTIKYI